MFDRGFRVKIPPKLMTNYYTSLLHLGHNTGRIQQFCYHFWIEQSAEHTENTEGGWGRVWESWWEIKKTDWNTDKAGHATKVQIRVTWKISLVTTWNILLMTCVTKINSALADMVVQSKAAIPWHRRKYLKCVTQTLTSAMLFFLYHIKWRLRSMWLNWFDNP